MLHSHLAETQIKAMNMPPRLTKNDRVILFDGVCKLCNAWANFIMKVDTKHHFILCSVQSTQGKDILAHFGYPTDVFETMLYIEGNALFDKSTAFFKIMRVLGFPWRALGVLQLLPLSLRNWLYDRIALNRYTLFGQYDYCQLPSPDHQKRFLNDE